MKKVLCATICLLTLVTFNLRCMGQEHMKRGYFYLNSGEYKLKISATFNYTLRSFEYKNVELIKPSGFCGTVIANAPGKFIGAGHKEGGEEQVKCVSLTVDGAKVNIKNGGSYTGQKIVLEKESMLDNLKQNVTLVLTPDGLTEAKSFEAVADQKLHLTYAFLLCWNTNTKEWIAKLADGKMAEGKFTGSKKFLLEKDIKWTAVYDPNSELGALMYFPKVIPGKGRKSTYWDVKNAYHKYYLMMDLPKVVKKGFVSKDNTLIIKAFQTGDQDWKTVVEGALPNK